MMLITVMMISIKVAEFFCLWLSIPTVGHPESSDIALILLASLALIVRLGHSSSRADTLLWKPIEVGFEPGTFTLSLEVQGTTLSVHCDNDVQEIVNS